MPENGNSYHMNEFFQLQLCERTPGAKLYSKTIKKNEGNELRSLAILKPIFAFPTTKKIPFLQKYKHFLTRLT